MRGVGGMRGDGGEAGVGWCAWQKLRDTVNERTIHILLECILVEHEFSDSYVTPIVYLHSFMEGSQSGWFSM